MPAYAYLRKSVVRQDDPANSAEAQEKAVRAIAARHGDSDSLVLLSDWDKSGKLGRSKRPGYDALWQAIESGTATAVYSYSMSRLARSVSELTKLFETCAAKSIPVRLEADVVDTSTASGRMTATILASVAAFEADVAGERMRAAMHAKADRGERIGTATFYGDRDGEDPDAVLAAFAEAGSFSAASKLLNARGIRPRASRRGWWPSSVAVVVRRLDPSLPALRPDRGVAAGGSEFTLGRLLHCPTCGTMLSGTRDRDGQRVRYSCRLGTSLPHPRISVTESHILPAVRDELARLRTPDKVETSGDEAQRADLEAKRLRVIDLYADGVIDKPERDHRLAAVTDALAALDDRRVVLAVPDVRGLDWTKPPRVLNELLRAVFERIDLDPATFQPRPDGFAWTVPEWRA
jgi:DNA invertase Pin-like site-specific DNA recombinase